MTKIATSYNNFSRAKLDKDLAGRYDLSIYSTGAEQFTNFISNFKGNAIYRTGLELMETFEDCVFVEFEFSQEQSYLCLFYENFVKFLTYDASGNFGFVQSGGVDLEVTSPYTLEQAREIQWSQNADVMKIVHPDVLPQDFTRVSANSFIFSDSVTTGIDWAGEDALDAVPTMTSNTTPAGTTISSSPSRTDAYEVFDNDDSTLCNFGSGLPASITVQLSSAPSVIKYSVRAGGLTAPKDWTLEGSNDGISWNTIDTQSGITWGSGERKEFILSATSTYTYHKFTATALSGGSALELVEMELLEEGEITDRYASSVLFKDGRLIYSRDTTVWFSEAGDYEEFTIPGTVVADSPIKITVADLTEEIQWLFSSERSVIGGNRKNLIAINGGDVNTPLTAENISVTITSADGSNDTIPVRKDGLVFYLGRNNRNAYYFQYDLLGETFKSDDANFVSYDITKDGVSKLRYKKDRNDLIYTIRGDGDLLALNFNQEEKIVGWSVHQTDGEVKDIAVITNNEGDSQLFALTLRDSVYYIERVADYVEFSDQEEFFTDDESNDAEAYIRMLGEELKQCIYLDNSQCLNDLQDNSITYDSGAGTITATSSVFVSGDVGKYIVYKTETGYEKGRFEITGYTSGTVVDVDVVIEPTANTYSDWYLTFSSISGLSRFEGEEVSVVGDGGYLGEFTVSSGEIDLAREVTTACVGIKYTGLIKTFNLGFSVEGQNTQKNRKNIFQAGVSLVNSAGGLIGASRYKLEPIQEINIGALNYQPPALLDGMKLISYNDVSKINKHLYIEQDKPLPMKICAVIVDTKYGVT